MRSKGRIGTMERKERGASALPAFRFWGIVRAKVRFLKYTRLLSSC